MNNLKGLLVLCLMATVIFTSCKKDKQGPVITTLKVNDDINTSGQGDHFLDTNIKFEVSATDETELSRYEVIEEDGTPPLLNDGELTGTEGSFSYTFFFDANKYATRDSVNLTFLVEDARGQSEVRGYKVIKK